jgi:hypothetical protein
MSKAERRKRARDRARERARTEGGAPSLPPLALTEDRSVEQLEADGDAEPVEAEGSDTLEGEAEDAGDAALEAEPSTDADALDAAALFGDEETESEFITSHVAAARPVTESRRVLEHEPVDEEDEDIEGPFEDETDGEDEGDDEDIDEEDALFNLACASLEQGAKLEWQELVLWLVTVDIDDPRLALCATLLAQEGKTATITSEKVLAALGRIGLGELVAEAREAVAEALAGAGAAAQPTGPKPIVRTSASALRAATKAAASPPPKPGLIGTPDRRGSNRRGAR